MYQEYYDNDNYQDDMNYSPVEEYNWSLNLYNVAKKTQRSLAFGMNWHKI